MTDRLTPEHRSWLMSRVRSRDTAPEMVLRRALRRLNVRYRSHQRVSGAIVDLVLPDLKTVVLVHGCFWHGCARHYKPPKSRVRFWTEKIRTNRARDARQVRALRAVGWTVVVFWSHSLVSNPNRVVALRLGLEVPAAERQPGGAGVPRLVRDSDSLRHGNLGERPLH